MKTRYERIGVNPHWGSFLSEYDQMRQMLDAGHSNDPDCVATRKNMWTHTLCLMCVSAYLQEEYARLLELVDEMLLQVEDMFFGEWRKSARSIPLDYYISGGGICFEPFRIACAFGLAIGRHDQIKRISGFTTTNKDNDTYMAPLKWWYEMLAEYIINGTSDRYYVIHEIIGNSKYKASQCFASGLVSIVCEKPADVVKNNIINAYRYWRRYHRKRDDYQFQLAIDATILYHMSRKLKIGVKMDAEIMDAMVVIG